MKRGHLFRTLIILAAIVLSLWWLSYSYKVLNLTEEQMDKMRENPEEYSKLDQWMSRSIKLGLDLKGGVHLVLETDLKGVENATEKKNMIKQAERVVRNRIDEFGVAEPEIQVLGDRRILVQLPGIKDEERAKSIIGRTAYLEFKVVKDGQILGNLITEIDKALAMENEGKVADTKEDSLKLAHPFAANLITRSRQDIVVLDDNYGKVKALLEKDAVRAILKKNASVFAWGKLEKTENMKYRTLLLLNDKAEMSGDKIATAQVAFGGALDTQAANKPYVSLEFTGEGADLFADVTGRNVGKRLAIVLDGVVNSAPTIQDKIRGGQARITGSFSTEEANDLAVVLRSGALPVPLKIIEERTVGPTLGKDSIDSGLKATITGLIAVVIFMVIYYTMVGLIADVALALNFVFIMAILAGFNAVLTLPGIAGLILTIGMAVDANVLIFERIREEIRAGKTALVAVENGYGKAFRTILDANITTLITAAILYQYGTGPIRGFAVTLSVGILSSMFTSIVVTRAIFDFFLEKLNIKKLYI